MTTASTYLVPAAATPGANESGMQTAANCSVVGRGAAGDVAAVNGANIGTPIAAWQFTRVPPS